MLGRKPYGAVLGVVRFPKPGVYWPMLYEGVRPDTRTGYCGDAYCGDA